MTLLQHKSWNFTKLLLLLSTMSCSKKIFWKNISSDLKTSSDRVAFIKAFTDVTVS